MSNIHQKSWALQTNMAEQYNIQFSQGWKKKNNKVLNNKSLKKIKIKLKKKDAKKLK